MIRPTEIECEVCRRPVTVQGQGRIPSMHRACLHYRNNFDRLQRSVDDATAGMEQAELAAFRKQLVSEFFHWTNGKFNAAKPNRKRT